MEFCRQRQVADPRRGCDFGVDRGLAAKGSRIANHTPKIRASASLVFVRHQKDI